MQLFEQFALSYLQFLLYESLGALHGVTQHVAHREETGLVVFYHAAVGRYVQLAVGEGVEGVEGLVRRHSRGEVYLYLHLSGGVVVHFPCLDFPLVDGFEYRLYQSGGCLAEGDFAYHERLVVELFDFRPHLELSAALSVVVFAHIDASACGEVGV